MLRTSEQHLDRCAAHESECLKRAPRVGGADVRVSSRPKAGVVSTREDRPVQACKLYSDCKDSKVSAEARVRLSLPKYGSSAVDAIASE